MHNGKGKAELAELTVTPAIALNPASDALSEVVPLGPTRTAETSGQPAGDYQVLVVGTGTVTFVTDSLIRGS